jgi:hypothetical protein
VIRTRSSGVRRRNVMKRMDRTLAPICARMWVGNCRHERRLQRMHIGIRIQICRTGAYLDPDPDLPSNGKFRAR